MDDERDFVIGTFCGVAENANGELVRSGDGHVLKAPRSPEVVHESCASREPGLPRIHGILTDRVIIFSAWLSRSGHRQECPGYLKQKKTPAVSRRYECKI